MSTVALDLGRVVDQHGDMERRMFSDAELDPLCRKWLSDALEATSEYERLSPAGRHLIQCVHAVPLLFEDVTTGHLEVYIGRTGATPHNVFSRFSDHHKNRGHEYGMICVACSTEKVSLWEMAYIRILQNLHASGRLCVANVSRGGRGGRLPQSKNSVVYVTWKLLRKSRPILPAGTKEINRIAIEVSSEIPELSQKTLQSALAPLAQTSDIAHVTWHSDHF